jgi:hypothetical protein
MQTHSLPLSLSKGASRRLEDLRSTKPRRGRQKALYNTLHPRTISGSDTAQFLPPLPWMPNRVTLHRI